MHKSEKKLVCIETALLIMFLLSIFVKNIVNDYFILLILLVTVGFTALLTGYEKDQNLDGYTQRKVLLYVGIYALGFVILQYGLGLILGYVKVPYKRDILSICTNTISTILIITASEYLRYMFVKKGEKRKVVLVLTFIVFVILDVALNVKLYDIYKLGDTLKLVTLVVLPSLFKNYVFTRFTYKYGVKQNILYRLITELYVYIMPFIPDLGMYLESVLMMIFPLTMDRILSIGFDKEKKKDFRDKRIVLKVLYGAVGVMAFIIIGLSSNLFRFWYVAIATGSMEPTLNIGDVVIVDKSYQKNADKLKVDDILAFKVNDKVYIHRIVSIDNQNNKVRIKTKGDRTGQIEDSWTVTNDDIVGTVKLRLRGIGYPTVWLSRILEANK